jgi:hypothetical protein
MKRCRERMSGACLLLRRKELFNLVELLGNTQLPRAIERFINQKAAIIGGPYIIRWRSSHTTAKAPCFLAQFTLSNLVGSGHFNMLVAHSNFLQDLLQSPENERFFTARRIPRRRTKNA